MPRGGGGRGGFRSSSPSLAAKSTPAAKQTSPPPAPQPQARPPATQPGLGAGLLGSVARGMGMGLGRSMADRLMDSIRWRPLEWPSDAIFMSMGAAAACGMLAIRRHTSYARAIARNLIPPPAGPRSTYAFAGAGGALGGMLVNSYRIALPPGWERMTDPSTKQPYYAHPSGLTQWERPN
mmetsp:Transcript_56536/g.89781  ORF Transcript_56536/g.89781 Transcript_56536/m.89781 type:complete len:180 (-) Transcript_56536:172-711(-)